MIPGISLTTTPKNAPYERPPETQDPDEAMAKHIENLMEGDTMESIIDVLEMGVDIKTIVEGLTRSAVMNGIHSVDVSLLVAPVIHEFIKGSADSLGVDYKEGFEEDPKVKAQLNYKRDVEKAKYQLSKIKEEMDVPEDSVPIEEPMMEQEEEGGGLSLEEPKGLMQRSQQAGGAS